MPSRCAIWARISTDEQESGNQLSELGQWAARRGLEIAAEHVLDGASAWRGEHRNQLVAALTEASLGRYDVLLVWALDRLDREGVESTLGLLRRFHETGASIWSLKEPWTETADPRLAELARRKAEGKPNGRRAGPQDRRPRRRSGYYARWERERTVVS